MNLRVGRKISHIFKIGTIHPNGFNERFSFIGSLHIPACVDKSGDVSPFHSIVNVRPPPSYSLRASGPVYWPTLKIANDPPIFAFYYAFVTVSLIWLSYYLSHDYLSYINSHVFFIYFPFPSDENRSNARNVIDFAIRIGRTAISLYFNLKTMHVVSVKMDWSCIIYYFMF